MRERDHLPIIIAENPRYLHGGTFESRLSEVDALPGSLLHRRIATPAEVNILSQRSLLPEQVHEILDGMIRFPNVDITFPESLPITFIQQMTSR